MTFVETSQSQIIVRWFYFLYVQEENKAFVQISKKNNSNAIRRSKVIEVLIRAKNFQTAIIESNDYLSGVVATSMT